jgi:hypothetical protein
MSRRPDAGPIAVMVKVLVECSPEPRKAFLEILVVMTLKSRPELTELRAN